MEFARTNCAPLHEIWPPWSKEQFFKLAQVGYTTGAGWKYADFNFDEDYKRLGVAPEYDNSNPDLRNFKKAGGKILLYEGGDDTIDLPGAVTDYWVEKGQAPEKLIGSHVSDDYLISHDPGLDFSNDRDVKLWPASWGLPEPLDRSIPVSFKRPVYPYPTLTRYLGHGDPHDPSSFGPVEPHQPK